MNRANIFGLHLNCRVKCKRYDEVGELYAVDENTCKIIFKSDRTAEYIKECKLILKPLSAISDEDKEEFKRLFLKGGSYFKSINFSTIYCPNLTRVVELSFYKDETSPLSSIIIGNEQTLWLASKGYDIGLVPDEYKEVEQ